MDICPNEASILRLIGAVPFEQSGAVQTADDPHPMPARQLDLDAVLGGRGGGGQVRGAEPVSATISTGRSRASAAGVAT